MEYSKENGVATAIISERSEVYDEPIAETYQPSCSMVDKSKDTGKEKSGSKTVMLHVKRLELPDDLSASTKETDTAKTTGDIPLHSNSGEIVEHSGNFYTDRVEQNTNNDQPTDNSACYPTSLLPSLEIKQICDEILKPEEESLLKKEPNYDEVSVPIEIENESKALLYRASDNPPFYLVAFFALQQCLMSLPSSVDATFLVSEAMCARDEDWFKAQLFSISILMSGVCTILQTTIGVRLPIYQGPISTYVLPLLDLLQLPEFACPTRLFDSGNVSSIIVGTKVLNQTVAEDGIPTDVYFDQVILKKFLGFSGALILAGGIHMLIGMTGMVGFVMRFVGPITVIPTMLLIALNFYRIIAQFCATHWGISSSTAVMAMFLSLYLNGRMMPIPVWTKVKGFHIIRYPLQQVFSVLLAVSFGWGIAGILTSAGALTDDRKSEEYYARTDFRLKVVSDTPWFVFPYPGVHGSPSFASGAFVAFMIGSISSIIESIADYYACARVCRVQSPPVHALNRGIFIEGFMSMVAGAYGASHATTSYGSNIGVIGITRVASRRVFQVFACCLIVLAFLGKFASIFVTIPYPVLGGTQIICFGIFIGLILTNIRYIDIKSTRNLAIIGISILVGLIVPNWSKKNLIVNTGKKETDSLIKMLMTNPNLAGGLLACILDNTVPGTLEERGMILWQKGNLSESESGKDTLKDSTMYEIPSWTNYFSRFNISSMVPFFPTYNRDTEKKEN
ncbi:hypothetical protein FSP39_007039 [Pinctada imbricata]|uniref:Solute carrier family 23 member 2 n=1 Tax=Pinctada imbricata TaxID=66713 RepID=A0AA89BSW0_PINIB|nr:hypothetical protein FSP39_007039 [Pinctada imbricata]